MKTSVVISVLLVLVCAAARTHDSSDTSGFAVAASPAAATATAQANAENTRSMIAGVAADLETYWHTTLGARVAAYHGPRAIVYYRSRIETACGMTFMQNAQYCPNDGTIYLDETWMDGFLGADDYGAIAVLAHEWGHEVQDELGAMDASSERRYVRALELQADCFAGLFTRSLQDGGKLGARALDEARRFFDSAGDPSPKTRSHGTGKGACRLVQRGLLRERPCRLRVGVPEGARRASRPEPVTSFGRANASSGVAANGGAGATPAPAPRLRAGRGLSWSFGARSMSA